MSILRRKPSDDGEVVAAMRFDVTDPQSVISLRESLRYGKAGSQKSWGWYEKIGEISQAVDRGSRVAGYSTIEVRETGTTKTVTGDKAKAAIGEVYSPFGGKRQLIERFVQLMKIDCEAHLVRNTQNGETNGYDFISTDELYIADDAAPGKTPGIYRRMFPGDGGDRFGFSTTKQLEENPYVERLDDDSYLGRVWIPHPRYTGLAKPGLWRLDLVCEELYTLTLSLLSRINQRLIMAGILYVPSEVSEVITASSVSANGISEDLGAMYGTSNKVVAQILHGMMMNIKSKGQAVASMPFVYVGAKGEKPEMISVDREMDLVELQLRSECLERVLNGLDAEKSSVTGTQDSNHWASKSDSDSDVRVNFGPELERLSWTLNMLIGSDLLPSGQEFWINTENAVSRPNLAEDARQSAELGAVSSYGVRRTAGIPESYAPDDDDLARQIGWKSGNPWLVLNGAPKTPEDWNEVERFSGKAKPGPSGDSSSDGTVDGTQPDTSDPVPESDTPKSKKPR